MGLFLSGLWRDLRHAARTLRRAPGFTAGVVLSLAVGIGGNTALFSVLDALTMRTLSVPAPEQLAHLMPRGWTGNPAPSQFSFPAFTVLRDQLSGSGAAPGGRMAAMSRVASIPARLPSGASGSPSGSDGLPVQLVSGEYFSTLGLAPALGRFLEPSDNRDVGAHPVAVISHRLWRTTLAGDPAVIGRTIHLKDLPFTIIGVAPDGFRGVWLESATDVWAPLAMQASIGYAQNFSSSNADGERPWMPQERIRWLDVILRVPAEQSAPALAALEQSFRQTLERHGTNLDGERRRVFLQQRLTLEPFDRGFSSVRTRFMAPLLLLMGMAALLLLIACANTANLLLARATRRRQELALRLSIGASRARVVQQLCTESLLLGVAGGVLGLVMAPWLGELLVRMSSNNFSGPAPFSVSLDRRVLLFTVAVALATSVLFGLLPALRGTRMEVSSTLRSGGRGAQTAGRGRPLKLLVVGQVALSLVLVVIAGLFLRSLRHLSTVDLGFERHHLISVSLNPKGSGYTKEEVPGLRQRLLDRARALPGVKSASLASCVLLGNCRTTSNELVVTGYQPRPDENVSVLGHEVGPGYFATVGMRLLAGRDFSPGDYHDQAATVAIVNEAFVRRYSPGQSAVGKRYGGGRPHIEIVGVVSDARTVTVREEATPAAFHPLRTGDFPGVLEIRTVGDPQLLMATLSRALSESEPRLKLGPPRTPEQQVVRRLGGERTVAGLTSVFGLLALGLACFGLYGIMSYGVASRTAELGVRMALGAPPQRLLWDVMRESLVLVFLGLAVGLALVLVGARHLTPLLAGVQGLDVLTLVSSGFALLLAGAVAAYLPARQAARVDPLVALRAD